ncbi:MAG: hypothetical protein AAF921_10785 [Cyanobacteria bacterium P01_D01_bin.44]
MMSEWNENLKKQNITYTLEVDGQFFLIENVPARVNQDTGEQLFAPETVEKLQEIIWSQRQPDRIIETPVYNYAA